LRTTFRKQASLREAEWHGLMARPVRSCKDKRARDLPRVPPHDTNDAAGDGLVLSVLLQRDD